MAGAVAACVAGTASARGDPLVLSGAAAVFAFLSGEALSCACLADFSAGLSVLFLSAGFFSALFVPGFSAAFFSGDFFSDAFVSDGFLVALLSALLSCLATGFASASLSGLAAAAGASASTATSAHSPTMRRFPITDNTLQPPDLRPRREPIALIKLTKP